MRKKFDFIPAMLILVILPVFLSFYGSDKLLKEKTLTFPFKKTIYQADLQYSHPLKQNNNYYLFGYDKNNHRLIYLQNEKTQHTIALNLNDFAEKIYGENDEIKDVIRLGWDEFLIFTRLKISYIKNKKVIWSKFIPEIFGENYYPLKTNWAETNLNRYNDNILGIFGGAAANKNKLYPFDFELMYSLNLYDGTAEFFTFKNPNYGEDVYKINQLNWFTHHQKIYINYGTNHVLHQVNGQHLDSLFLDTNQNYFQVNYQTSSNPQMAYLQQMASKVKYSDLHFSKKLNKIINVKYIPFSFTEIEDRVKLKHHIIINTYDTLFNSLEYYELDNKNLSVFPYFLDNEILFKTTNTETDTAIHYQYTVYQID